MWDLHAMSDSRKDERTRTSHLSCTRRPQNSVSHGPPAACWSHVTTSRDHQNSVDNVADDTAFNRLQA